MSTPQLERAELLFRRQVALEGNAPRREWVRRIDAVTSLTDAPSVKAVVAASRGRGGLLPMRPDEPLLASAGHFNVSRIEPDAVAWTILIGGHDLASLEQILLTLCNVQSAKQNFRPIFIVEVLEHVELMRRYGFTFEVLCDPVFFGMSKEEQIELYMAKWNSRYRVDLGKNDSLLNATEQGTSEDLEDTASFTECSPEAAGETDMSRAL